MNIDSIIRGFLDVLGGKGLVEVLDGDWDGVGRFILFLGSKGISVFDNLDYFTEQYIKNRKAGGEKFQDFYARRHVENIFFNGMRKLSESKETMDDAFAYSLCSRGITLAKYIDRADYASILRDSNGDFRDRKLFSSLGVKSLKSLMGRSMSSLDPEGLEFLRSLSKGKEVLTDEVIFESLRKRLQYKSEAGSIEKHFGKYLLGEDEYKKTLSSYWKYLEDKKVFESDTPENVLHDAYDAEVVRRNPEAFVDKLLNIGRQEAFKANIFMLKMINDGIDCYTGFMFGHHGMFAEFDSRGLPRNYISMIDVCLKNRPLPGYKALLASIPLEEVKHHPRASEVLNIIHEMTGRHDAVKMMDRKNKGRAIINDLGI